MIEVDDRIGSVDLVPIFQKHAQSPAVSALRLFSGDVAFDGMGPKGAVRIGIERKRMRDMISSMRKGRYSGSQLPTLLQYYDEFFLFVEGLFREGFAGALEVQGDRGGWYPLRIGDRSSPLIQYTELDRFLCTIESHTPVNIRRTQSPEDTVSQIVSLYHHRQKPWDKHHSHQALYTPQSTLMVGKAGLVRKWASDLSGIGWEKSGSVAIKFRTGLELAMAGPEEWLTIPGIGKTLAQRAYDQIRGDWKDPGEL